MPDAEATPAHEFASVKDIRPLSLMDGLRVRPVSGERITPAVFELDPGIAMPEHRHPNEQVGVVVRGELPEISPCSALRTRSGGRACPPAAGPQA